MPDNRGFYGTKCRKNPQVQQAPRAALINLTLINVARESMVRRRMRKGTYMLRTSFFAFCAFVVHFVPAVI
jgi:hypothetical protein